MSVPDLATITALTGAIAEGFKAIVGLVDTMKDAKAKEAVRAAVVDLKEKVMDQREIILALREENIALKERAAESSAAASTKARMRFDGKFYWLDPEPGTPDKPEGPFCQTCKDRDQKESRLQDWTRNRPQQFWRCFVCGSIYKG